VRQRALIWTTKVDSVQASTSGQWLSVGVKVQRTMAKKKDEPTRGRYAHFIHTHIHSSFIRIDSLFQSIFYKIYVYQAPSDKFVLHAVDLQPSIDYINRVRVDCH